MYEWNYEVQKMIDFIEEHILENPTLDSIFCCSPPCSWHDIKKIFSRQTPVPRNYTSTGYNKIDHRHRIGIRIFIPGGSDESFPVYIWM